MVSEKRLPVSDWQPSGNHVDLDLASANLTNKIDQVVQVYSNSPAQQNDLNQVTDFGQDHARGIHPDHPNPIASISNAVQRRGSANHRINIDHWAPLSALSIAAWKASMGCAPTSGLPLMKNVGVPRTPAFWPSCESACTRSAV